MKNYRLVIRAIPGFHITKSLDGNLTIDEALAETYQIHPKLKRCLITPDGVCYWIKENNKIDFVEEGEGPSMSIGGQKVSLTVKG